jgi:hypothetical protein
MSVDSTNAVSAAEAASVNASYSVGVLRKEQDQQKIQGAEAIRLIDEATPQMTKTADGHISVRA